MPVVLLIRHGRTGSNASGTLAGRTPGVSLDETGTEQATRLAERLRVVRPAHVVSSPLDRCMQTARAVSADVEVEQRLQECDYGEWTGRQLSDLRRLALWKVVQEHPSGAVFPGGESLREMQARAVDAVREHDARIAGEHGRNAVWVAVSHGDVIKSVVADALGMHLDHFQRLVVDPASVSVIAYSERRPFVMRINDTGEDLRALRSGGRGRRRTRSGDAVVGGGAG